MKKELSIPIKIESETLDKVIVKLIYAMVLVQFFMVFLVNCIRIEALMDYDAPLALRHCVEMWTNHTFSLKGFVYFSTLEIDSALFFATPFYLLTGNIGIFTGVIHALLYIFILFVICDIFKCSGKKVENGFLATLLLFTPYVSGSLDWANMIFFSAGQYEFRILTMLLMVDLLLVLDKQFECAKKKWVILFIITLIVNGWTSFSCGNYVLLMVLFPMVIWLFFQSVKEQGVVLNIRQTAVIIINAIVSIVGWRLHIFCAGPSMNNDKFLNSAYVFMSNLWNQITGIFMLFGGIGYAQDVSILSVRGVWMIARFVFVVGLFTFFVYKLITEKSKCSVLIQLCGFVFLVNVAVLILTNTTYGSPVCEYRYHILWASLMVVCLAEILQDYHRLPYGKLILCALIFAVVIFNTLGFGKMFLGEKNDLLAKEILLEADAEECESIYLFNMSVESHIIRALDLDRNCLSFTNKDGMLSADTGDFYEELGDNTSVSGKHMLVIKEADFLGLPQYYQDAYTLKKAISKDYCVYVSEENGFDFVSGLPDDNLGIDFPYSNGYSCIGEWEENGCLKVEGKEGIVLCGPFTKTKPGKYNITLHYEAESIKEADDVWFDVCQSGEDESIAIEYLKNESDAVTLKNVEFRDGELMLVRIGTTVESSFLVHSISFERID